LIVPGLRVEAVVGILAEVACYVVVIWMLGITAEDRTVLHTVTRRLRAHVA
jgi:hypothetical protein